MALVASVVLNATPCLAAAQGSTCGVPDLAGVIRQLCSYTIMQISAPMEPSDAAVNTERELLRQMHLGFGVDIILI